MNGADVWEVANEMARSRNVFSGNPYSRKEVEAHETLVSMERTRLMNDRRAYGDSSELAQEIKRQSK